MQITAHVFLILLICFCVTVIIWLFITLIQELKEKKNKKTLEKTILESLAKDTPLAFIKKCEDPFEKPKYATVLNYKQGYIQYKTTTDLGSIYVGSMSLDSFYKLYKITILTEQIEN